LVKETDKPMEMQESLWSWTVIRSHLLLATLQS
jgi:hypothetical protein